MKKRMLSLFLALCMVLTLLPSMALATEKGEDVDVEGSTETTEDHNNTEAGSEQEDGDVEPGTEPDTDNDSDEDPPEPVLAEQIVLSEDEMNLVVGKSQKLTAEVLPEDTTDKTVVWSSDNPEIAEVAEDGTVKAISRGKTVITATCGAVTASCQVAAWGIKRQVPLTSITFEKDEFTMKALTQQTLTVNYHPAGTTDDKTVVWTSSAPDIVSVEQDGTLTANKLGSAVITAEVADKIASCTVIVGFADVDEDAYYYSDVYWALDNGITQGTTEVTFSPDATCTRAQAVSFLWRVNGNPASSGTNPFQDVYSDAYYYEAVSWAYQNGIVTGTSATQFSPDQTCTRAEIITMIWRCRRQWPNGQSAFWDVTNPSYYYYPVVWATEVGITSGYAPGEFAPDVPCTRAHIVRFLHNCEDGEYAKLDQSAWQLYYPKAEAVLNQVGWDLRAAFNWSASLTYYGHGKADMPEDPSPGIEWFADFGFTYRKGNCYVMAATFYEMAVLLGYAPRQMSGRVPLASGGWGPHSWVEIDFNGQTYVFDPDFTYGTGRNGYMISYGQTGTWRYADYSPMSR